MVDVIIEDQLTEKQKLYFHPSKAAKYKDYIEANLCQGLKATDIHKQLLEDFPDATDVSVDSIRRLARRINKNKKNKKASSVIKLTGNPSKSEEIRKVAKEIIESGVELRPCYIIKTLAARGVCVHSSHVHAVLGPVRQGLTKIASKIAEEVQPAQPVQPTRKYSLEELTMVKDFLDLFEGSERAIKAICTKITPEELSLAKEFADKLGGPEVAVDAIKNYNRIVRV